VAYSEPETCPEEPNKCFSESIVASFVWALFGRIGTPFDLRHTWSVVNRFRTGHGPCRTNLHKWGLVQSPGDACTFDMCN